MRSKLYILAGIPGTGKSTWARNFFPEYVIVSTDAIREELWPGEEYKPERNAEVFDTFHERIEDKLSFGRKLAVADSTALMRRTRPKLKAIAAEHGAETHLVVFTATAQGFENNPNRDARWVVPDEAMEHMLVLYEQAIEDIKGEGYDSITYIEGVE